MSGPEERPHTILCVDDEIAVLSALRRVFLHEEWQVLIADSPEKGLELVREHEVDLIISDYRMPGTNGVDFLRHAMQIRPQCIRIILSAHADIEAISSALNAGQVYRFLSKPWDNEELRAAVRMALEPQACRAGD